ncbi:MAG: ParA family protein [Gemmatimonadetes bacterium]|nr:ParA family protein [Gemmatimonadota bacterium]
MRRIAITLQKGGVGKTSVAVNLAAALAADQGLRTVLVDMDAQCNATAHMLGDDFSGPMLSDVLRGDIPLRDALVQCHHENLRVLPGAEDLVDFERGSDDPRRARTIMGVRDMLTAGIPTDTEVVIIDTPPGGGLWLQAALAASDGFLIVAWPDGFSASGILALLNTVDDVRAAFNPNLELDGLIINHVRHTAGHRGYTEVFSQIYEDILLHPPLPVRSVISDARDAAMPVEFYERQFRTSSQAAELFRDIAGQLVRRTGIRTIRFAFAS